MAVGAIYEADAAASEAAEAKSDSAGEDAKTAGKTASRKSAGRKVKDRELADKLVELDRLNRWQAEQLLNGRTKWNLGPYRIVDAIGQGGMGQVFRAEHTIMKRVVAIKVLPLNRSTPDAVASFRREIQAQAQLDHENLVRAYDAGQDGNVHFLVTEFVPGVDLRRLIKRNGKLSTAAASSIISQAARGLEHAHSRGLIHRDVKPGNLLVSYNGYTKVSDLGLAGFMHADEDDSHKNKTVGTADYLSPEQIMQPDSLTPACDIYSLGCTLYYAVTAKVPFPGGNTRDKARAHCHDQPIDPRRLNPDLDPAFVDVIADMMVKDPLKRIRTASEVVERLQPWVSTEWDLPEFVESGPQPTRRRPARRSGSSSGLSDTKPLMDDELPHDSNSDNSQVSQSTHPVASASEETLPMFENPFQLQKLDEGFSPAVVIAILMGFIAAITVMAMIIYQVVSG